MKNFGSWSLDEANPRVQRWQIRALLAIGYHPPDSATCRGCLDCDYLAIYCHMIFATLVVAILLATFFVTDTRCLSLVVAKLVMNEVEPWSLLDSTCGRIWWNVDDIQRPVVLGFAISVVSDWLHPTTNFQSYSHTI